jgi:hypothetical protein
MALELMFFVRGQPVHTGFVLPLDQRSFLDAQPAVPCVLLQTGAQSVHVLFQAQLCRRTRD